MDSEGTLAALYDQYADRVRGSIYRDTRDVDAAEELTQEAFIRLGKKLPGRYEPAELLTLIVSGLVKNWYRDQSRRPEFEDLDELDFFPDGRLSTWQDYAFGLRLDCAVRALDEGPRDAFILTTLRGLTQEEAGAVLDITQQAVAKRLQAATDSVREDVS